MLDARMVRLCELWKKELSDMSLSELRELLDLVDDWDWWKQIAIEALDRLEGKN